MFQPTHHRRSPGCDGRPAPPLRRSFPPGRRNGPSRRRPGSAGWRASTPWSGRRCRHVCAAARRGRRIRRHQLPRRRHRNRQRGKSSSLRRMATRWAASPPRPCWLCRSSAGPSHRTCAVCLAGQCGWTPEHLLVLGPSPLRDLAGLVAAPGEAAGSTYGNTGVGGDDHIAMLALKIGPARRRWSMSPSPAASRRPGAARSAISTCWSARSARAAACSRRGGSAPSASPPQLRSRRCRGADLPRAGLDPRGASWHAASAHCPCPEAAFARCWAELAFLRDASGPECRCGRWSAHPIGDDCGDGGGHCDASGSGAPGGSSARSAFRWNGHINTHTEFRLGAWRAQPALSRIGHILYPILLAIP